MCDSLQPSLVGWEISNPFLLLIAAATLPTPVRFRMPLMLVVTAEIFFVGAASTFTGSPFTVPPTSTPRPILLRRPTVCLTPKVKLGPKLFFNPYVFTTPKKLAAMGAVTVIPIRGWRMVRPIVPGTPEVGTDGPILTVPSPGNVGNTPQTTGPFKTESPPVREFSYGTF